MATFLFALNAIMPIILLIFFGYLLKKKNFLDEVWFKKGNKFVFRACLPVLLFVNVYNIESFEAIGWSVVLFAEISIFVIFFLALLIVKLFVPDEKQKGVVLQCAIRSNYAIIGIPLAEALGGAESVGIASVISAFSIPTFNVLAVIALSMFLKAEDGKKVSIKEMALKIVKNPLIIGVACGMVVLGIRTILPKGSDGLSIFSLREDVPFLFAALNNIAKMCSPLALIVLGGQFDFAAVKGLKKQIIIGTVSRVAVVPVLALSAAVAISEGTNLLQFDASCYPALIALFGSPVAVSSAIMAQEMDNDGVLAGQLVVWTSIASIFTLFVIIAIMREMGLL